MSIWGKLLGGAAGFAIGGPIGAIIGVVAGHHVVDKHKNRDAQIGHGDRQAAFTTAVIVLAAKMAKADGVVTRDEVDAFKTAFHIPPEEMAGVGQIFDEAKRSADGYEPYAEQVGALFQGERQVLEELVGALFHIARADGVIHPNEVQYLRRVSLLLGFSEAEFERLRTIFMGVGSGGRARSGGNLAEAYEILGVDAKMSDDAIKQVYRKLVRENHPDALMAKGMPEEFIATANEKLAAINDAYDRIKRARGLT